MIDDELENHMLSVREAYEAAFSFLKAYWERGSRSSDDIADLLSSMNLDVCGKPLDQAQWSDWLNAVRSNIELPKS